jgi:2-haloacid dehalogenase
MAFVCLFDVNETLLDLSALDPLFARAFGEGKPVRTEWFQQLLQSAFLSTLLGPYTDFGTLAAAALDMVAEKHERVLPTDQQAAILQGMHALPPHPEVPGALARLRGAGVRLAALTNSPLGTARAQIAAAGLEDYFEEILSAGEVARLKPAPEPYRMAAERMGVPIGETLLVAAHAWDTTGALRAGARAAFVARPGQVLDPLGPRPEIIGADLAAVADQLLALTS